MFGKLKPGTDNILPFLRYFAYSLLEKQWRINSTFYMEFFARKQFSVFEARPTMSSPHFLGVQYQSPLNFVKQGIRALVPLETKSRTIIVSKMQDTCGVKILETLTALSRYGNRWHREGLWCIFVDGIAHYLQ